MDAGGRMGAAAMGAALLGAVADGADDVTIMGCSSPPVCTAYSCCDRWLVAQGFDEDPDGDGCMIFT